MADLMTMTTEEILAYHKRWSYVRTDRNGTRYFADYRCTRCGGRGGWEGWPGYVCYECGGSGRAEKAEVYKVYTPAHAAKLEAQRNKRAQAKLEARLAKLREERPQNMEKAGFGNEDGIWVIYRVMGETFSIKDQLKELGCHFKPQVGWYSSHNLDGYECQRMTETDVLSEGPAVEWKDMDAIAPLLKVPTNQKVSEFQGEVGQRLDITVTVKRIMEFESRWGRTYMILFEDENGNQYKWSTSTYVDFLENDVVTLRATVKAHEEYKNIKQTVLTRAKVA